MDVASKKTNYKLVILQFRMNRGKTSPGIPQLFLRILFEKYEY